MNITSAQYAIDSMTGQNGSITIVVNGKTKSVPLDPKNIDYAEIMRQVEAGTLTIQDAD